MRSVLGLIAGLALALGVAGGRALGSGALPSAPLAISISRNVVVNQDGQTVRLLGVDEESTEYACFYGYAYSNDDHAAGAAAIHAWHADAVRIPLNEDCWLGINRYGYQVSWGCWLHRSPRRFRSSPVSSVRTTARRVAGPTLGTSITRT